MCTSIFVSFLLRFFVPTAFRPGWHTVCCEHMFHFHVLPFLWKTMMLCSSCLLPWLCVPGSCISHSTPKLWHGFSIFQLAPQLSLPPIFCLPRVRLFWSLIFSTGSMPCSSVSHFCLVCPFSSIPWLSLYHLRGKEYRCKSLINHFVSKKCHRQILKGLVNWHGRPDGTHGK